MWKGKEIHEFNSDGFSDGPKKKLCFSCFATADRFFLLCNFGKHGILMIRVLFVSFSCGSSLIEVETGGTVPSVSASVCSYFMVFPDLTGKVSPPVPQILFFDFLPLVSSVCTPGFWQGAFLGFRYNDSCDSAGVLPDESHSNL